jgi:hypothetical protein
MVTDAMVEAGARALCAAVGHNPDNVVPSVGIEPDDPEAMRVWQHRVGESRACLEAGLSARGDCSENADG